MKRSSTLTVAWEMVTSHQKKMAIGAALWLLFLLTAAQPLHLAQEVHAFLPASAQHHASTHCEQGSESVCEKPNDDVSQPLSGEQHKRHHETCCSKICCSQNLQFAVSVVEAVSVAPQSWEVSTLEFAPVPLAPRLEVPAFPKKSRAPPQSQRAPLSVSVSSQSGRAPPVEI